MTSLATPKSMTPVRLLWQAAQPGSMSIQNEHEDHEQIHPIF